MPRTTAMTECRLLLDPACSGVWNMAVDEMLLEQSAAGAGCCWRFYGWGVPTLSLGYFQAYEDRRQHADSAACPAVRRLTGGGAIVHDVELTYSIVVPRGHPLAARRETLYTAVHRSLINTLTDWGIKAVICDNPPKWHGSQQPFLCFQRRAPGDVLLGDLKIAGSAQRRRRGAVLQHGSVLLGRSPAAEELDGPAEAGGDPIAADALSDAWLNRLSEGLALRWREEALSENELRLATDLAEARYLRPQWTENRVR